LNHSANYTIAAIGSWGEYWLEAWLLGSYKQVSMVNKLGLVFVVLGQSVRTTAMLQCGENFSHNIAMQRQPQHRLVTHGIYAYLRHPSYAGWFYWSLGTQLVLCNPLCVLLYALVSWKFFRDRIAFEESTLLHFFKDKYREYVQHSYVGIPFISSDITRSNERPHVQ
jgi:protein-S-isoprenylcysteine O-methyltransferase